MKQFGRVRFNFDKNTIELGELSITGLSTTNNHVRLCENTTIPARSEKDFFVKCSTINALLEGNFEPKTVPNISRVYANRNRIIPNIDSLFPIAVLNVTKSDIQLKSRKLMGFIRPTSETVSYTSACKNEEFDINDITLSNILSATETSQLKSLIAVYKDVFAANPRKPKRTDLVEHKIVANNALPVCYKPRRIPVTWEKDVDEQVSEMLNNDIIRPSYSPWNAPVILVKRKDNPTRFVCDFRGVNDVTKRIHTHCLISELLLTRWLKILVHIRRSVHLLVYSIVFDRLRAAKVTLKSSKCIFAAQKLIF